MGNSINFSQIQGKYGQNGVDYVAFRYHQRNCYRRIKTVINRILEQARIQQQDNLEFINQYKSKLKQEFNKAKSQAETQRPGSIRQAEAKSKQSVSDFSGFNAEMKRLDDLYQSVKSNYEEKKAATEKRIREEIMKQQNKSNLQRIKEFDNLSDRQRKDIELDCIKMHPQKANEADSFNFETRFTWESQKSQFQGFFYKEKVEKESEEGRKRVRTNILPSSAPICC